MAKNLQAGYESIRLSFSKKSTYEKIIGIMFIPLVFVALYMITGILAHTVTDLKIPNEYRESANVFMTMELMKGNNPYALSSLDGELPPFIYLYGPLYSLVTAGIGTLLNALGLSPDIVLLHYAVTFICIMASSALAFYMVWKKTGSLTLGVAGFIFLINCSWRYNYVNAVPDTMGLFLMMLILFLLSAKDFRGKEIICGILTVVIFFTKQYFLLIAGTAVIFLFLFRGIKSTAKYLASFGITAAAVYAFLKINCPLFETYMFYFAKGPGKGVASTVRRGDVKLSGMEYNFQQLMSIGGIFLMFFVAEAACCLYFFIGFLREWKALKVNGSAGKFADRIAAAGKNAGIDEFDILMLIHMAVSGICLTYLGRNDGAWLSYYLELFIPALVMGALVLYKKLSMILSERGLYGINKRTSFLILSAFLLMLLGFTISRADERLPISPLSEEDHAEWEKAEKVLDEHPGDMYLYPLLGYYGIHHDIYVYNYGQPFVVSEKFYNSYNKHPDMQARYPYAGEIFTSHLDFRKKLKERVRNGEYSMVSYIEGTDEVFDRDDLKLKYEKCGTYALRTGRQVWDTEIWKLK
ncbi:MAG: hypothetical protein K5668_00730 [Lachnospiraceae bacterium]|nr:hypothetical protein [Lachnospiraceae bacterium]